MGGADRRRDPAPSRASFPRVVCASVRPRLQGCISGAPVPRGASLPRMSSLLRPAPPVRILFVCLGNICRSPTAEAAFLALLARRGRADGFVVDSAGTGSAHLGEEPHPETRREAARNGITLRHRARQATRADFARFDLLLAMDGKNERDLLALARTDEERAKVRLFRRYEAGNERASEPQALDVPDPWYTGEFARVFAICTAASEGLLASLDAR